MIKILLIRLAIIVTVIIVTAFIAGCIAIIKGANDFYNDSLGW